MNTFTIIFLLFFISAQVIEFWLSQRQKAYVFAHRNQVPPAFSQSISLADHQKAADYTIEKSQLADIEHALSAIILLLLTIAGGINNLFEWWSSFNFDPLVRDLTATASLLFILAIVDIPSHYYQTFVIEQKYGFNKSTLQQFIKDQLLSLGLSLLIGLPLFAIILIIMKNVGNSWWLWAWMILIGFSLLMSWLFPTLIAPLFNTFTPMAEGNLKQRIQTLLERCGFQSNGIFIMDGSKRSGHGNAYFTGLGNHKRIVFYDTLINSLEDEELEAVLAHELGHFKRKHVIKMLIASSLMSFISFAILGWLINELWFYQGLGVQQSSNAVALLLFMLVSPVFTTFMQPISAYFQRQFEFEADDFAAEHAQASRLISGLVKLYTENASTLTPDPLYSAFHYSHPPAAIRIAHLQTKLNS